MAASKSEVAAASVAGQRSGARVSRRDLPRPERLRVAGWAAYIAVLTLLFVRPLTRLALYAAGSQLNSHILLVPFVTGYLLFTRRPPAADCRCSLAGAAPMIAAALAAAATGLWWHGTVSVNDELALMALGFVGFVAAGGYLFLGSEWMAASAFPVAFLIFLAPLPDAAVNWLENVSALASAEAAALYFSLAGTSLVRNGTVFELPGVVLRVGQECSGIHSSWVLFITGLLASHLFLKARWRRMVLIAFVIPLGVLRNGFRILVIGLLCVKFGPQMLDSIIHRRGGPVFFAISLVPLLLLLWWLRHQEQRLNLAG